MRRLNRIILLSFLILLNAENVVIADINVESALLQYQQKINFLKRENKNLSGQIEQLQQRQKISEDKIKELFSLIKYKQSTPVLKQRSNKLNAEAEKVYTRARRLLASAQYPQAIITFRHYLKKYLNNKHTADAQYWLSKAYLAQTDYANTVKNLIIFQKKFPLHSKYPNSLFELAKAYVKLDQNHKATQILDRLHKKFPTHLIATKAQALLAKIKPKITVKPAIKPDLAQPIQNALKPKIAVKLKTPTAKITSKNNSQPKSNTK